MIHIKAQQTLVKFNKADAGTLLYVMRPETYSQLAENKVISEASVRSGIQRGALKGAWDAIGEVIKAWVTEGHSVAIPGLGSLRFSMNANAVADVNDVAKSLIRSRKVVFTPSVDIKNELKQLKVAITCYDKDGKEVKRVTDDNTEEEVVDNEGNGGGQTPDGGQQTGGNGQQTGDNTGDTPGGNTGGNTGGGADPDDPENSED